MRVKTGPYRHERHKKVLAMAKGFRMSKHRLLKAGKDAVLHAGEYAFAGRKNRKRDIRRLWITRINGALDDLNISYSVFINDLKKANIEVDRKILSDLVSNDPETFKAIVEKCRLTK